MTLLFLWTQQAPTYMSVRLNCHFQIYKFMKIHVTTMEVLKELRNIA